MQYFGGKTSIAKDIVKVIESRRKEGQPYLEPFVGGASVLSQITGKRYACDKHPYLIAMYKELQNGWIPPENVDEETYKKAKDGELPDYLVGFIGFACSFAGKWFGGYARANSGYNYAKGSKNSLMKKLDKMSDVTFSCKDYCDINPKGFIIYCDPPYKGTTQYGKIVGDFDTEQFWSTMREWSKDNTVIISEYNAPEDFECIWEKKTETKIRDAENKQKKSVEKLFMYKGA